MYLSPLLLMVNFWDTDGKLQAIIAEFELVLISFCDIIVYWLFTTLQCLDCWSLYLNWICLGFSGFFFILELGIVLVLLLRQFVSKWLYVFWLLYGEINF